MDGVTTRLRFLGVAGYEISGPRGRLVIDPYLTGNPAAPLRPGELPVPDLLLVTHGAFDHLGDTAGIALGTGAPVVCGGDVRALLLDRGVPSEQVRATVWGVAVEVAGLVVHPVESRHWSFSQLGDGTVLSGPPLGYVVETEPGVVLYHTGDSALFGDMGLIGQLHRPTVGLLGCAQPRALLPGLPGPGRVVSGEMTPRAAALAAGLLGVGLAVASHYLDPADPDVAEFRALVPGAVAPRPGQTLVMDGDHSYLEE